MTCNDCSSQLSAYLDGELPNIEGEAIRDHLAGCADCQLALAELEAVDGILRDRLSVRNLEMALARLERSLPTLSSVVLCPASVAARTADHRGPSHGWGAVLLSSLALVAILSLLRVPAPVAQPAAVLEVARIAVAVGEIELQRPGEDRWSPVTVDAGPPTELVEGARLRTAKDALCELQTTCDGTLRLNSETEVVVYRQERVELVRGQLWALAARQCDLNVQLPSGVAADAGSRRPPVSLFTCPSSSEVQWQVQDSGETCLALTSPAVSVTCEKETYSIEKGEAFALANGRPDDVAFRTDPLLATLWQIPLLARKSPDDAELQGKLDAMLAVIGETKVSYLYEEQIRELGPAGAAPLIAYVRSPRSRDNPRHRHRAMSLISQMASIEQIAEVEALQSDEDPVVRQSAAAALHRLRPEPRPLLKARN